MRDCTIVIIKVNKLLNDGNQQRHKPNQNPSQQQQIATTQHTINTQMQSLLAGGQQ